MFQMLTDGVSEQFPGSVDVLVPRDVEGRQVEKIETPIDSLSLTW